MRAFQKCGVALAVDGSEDNLIQLPNVDSYSMDVDDDSEPCPEP